MARFSSQSLFVAAAPRCFESSARDEARGSTGSSIRGISGNPAYTLDAHSKHLDIQRFMALPLSVILEVCKYLQFQDLTSLSRTSIQLRTLFMSKILKRCWDAARWLQNMPEWTGVAAPRAAAFIFDDACQGEGCNQSAKLKTFHVGKRYCPDCAPTYLLDWDYVAEQWPGISYDLFNQLPWTKKRASNNVKGVDEGRFVMRERVEHLQARLLQIGVDDRAGIGTLKRQQKKAWKEAQMAARLMETWTRGYEDRVWRAKNKAFTEFLQGITGRWGWNLDKLPAVRNSPQFIALEKFVENSPKLDSKVWKRAEAVIKSIMEENAKKKEPEHRPWSVTISQSLQQYSSTPGASSSKGNRR